MPWTTHGYWTGLREPTEDGPPRLDCGGPHRCLQCATEAHQLEAEAVSVDTTPTFDEPLQFSVEITTSTGTPAVITTRMRGIALDADSLTRGISTCISAAMAGAAPETPA